MKGSNGYRKGTRGLKVRARDRGKIKIRSYMKEFDMEERVSISINPTYQNIPHPKFQGRSGKISGKQGRAYYINIMDGGKEKKVLVNPEHLKALK